MTIALRLVGKIELPVGGRIPTVQKIFLRSGAEIALSHQVSRNANDEQKSIIDNRCSIGTGGDDVGCPGEEVDAD